MRIPPPERLVVQDVVGRAGVVPADHQPQHAEGPNVAQVLKVHHREVAVWFAHLRVPLSIDKISGTRSGQGSVRLLGLAVIWGG